MLYFFKPIALSLRYKWTLIASIVVALGIGVLWGASITTIYPFVEVIFEGKSIDTWFDGKITDSQESVKKLDAEMAEIQQRLRNAEDREAAQLKTSYQLKGGRREVAARSVEFYTLAKQRLSGVAPTTPFGTLVLLMALLLLATLLKGVCRVLNVVLVARIANRTTMDMRRIFYRKALQLDQMTIDQMGAAKLMTQLLHNMNLVNTGLKKLYGQSVREPLKMAACLAVAACISWRLLLLSLVTAPLCGLLMHYLGGRMKRAARNEMGGVAGVLQTLMETLNGLKIVRVFNAERRERRRFKRNAQTLHRLSMRIAFYDSLVHPITELTGVTALIISILAGAYLVINQETHLFGIRVSETPLSPTALFVFFGMLGGISDPARKMSGIYNSLVRAELACRNLYRAFEEEQHLMPQEPVASVPLAWKKLRIKNAHFAYRLPQMVLGPVDLEIAFGETVALVGANGCGKTTLVNLLMRFCDPTDGDIFLDDVNLKNVKPGQLRRQFAMVTQDPVLFRGTIWENIKYGDPTATKEQVLEAARIARVDEIAAQMPGKYNKRVGDQGKFLSGGQRQRVALARAVLANPRIIILDEATSQMDQRGEQRVHASMREFLKQRTAVVITHRRSTLALADRVIVMDAGRVVANVSAEEYLSETSPLIQQLPAA